MQAKGEAPSVQEESWLQLTPRTSLPNPEELQGLAMRCRVSSGPQPAWEPGRLLGVVPATHEGEMVVIGLCLIAISRVQGHGVHAEQHFGRCITLGQFLGSAAACGRGGCSCVWAHRAPLCPHPAHAGIKGLSLGGEVSFKKRARAPQSKAGGLWEPRYQFQ